MSTVKKSKFGKLDWKDIVRGALLAFAVAFLIGAQQVFSGSEIEWTFVFWQPTIYAGVTAMIAYLIKNLLTNSEDEILTKEHTG